MVNIRVVEKILCSSTAKFDYVVCAFGASSQSQSPFLEKMKEKDVKEYMEEHKVVS